MTWVRSTFNCGCGKSLDRYTVLIDKQDQQPGYTEGSKVQCEACGRTGVVEDDFEECWVAWDDE